MAVTQWDLTSADAAWVAARGLICRLDEGYPLPVIGNPLETGSEAVHLDVLVNGWWYGATDVLYDEVRYMDFRGLGTLAMTAAASAVGNRRAREAAQALATPQWRPLGEAPVQVSLTERHLVLRSDEATVTLALADGLQLLSDLPNRRLELHAPDRPPFALHGHWVPYLTVALTYASSGEVLLLDQLTSPTAPPPPPAPQPRKGLFNPPRGPAQAANAVR